MPTFDTPGPVSAVLDVPSGHIRVIAADRTDTAVEVLPADASRSRDVQAAKQTEVAYGDGILRVEVPAANTRVLGSPGSVEVIIQLPAGSRIEAKAASTEFRGVGRLGGVAFDGHQAAVKVDEAATARLSTRAGDISVGRLGGPAEISTAQGDIRVTEAVCGEVVLRTELGDISVGAARSVSAALDASTPHGRIHNALNNTDGTADLNIHATTSSGDITARNL